jgi:hypothetical protein
MAETRTSRHRGWWIALAVVAVLIAAVVAASFWADEPLRRYAEAQANEQLPDYRVTIGALDLHPLTVSVDLRDVTVRQQAHPEPALAVIPLASVDARLLPLFSGTLAADVRVEQPVIAATRRQIDAALHQGDRQEAKEQAVSWQDRVRVLMPVRMGLAIAEARVRYEGAPLAEPLELQHLNVRADHVTNRPREGDRYPADLHVDVTVWDQAQITVDGKADPLAKPIPAVDADVHLHDLHVERALKTLGKSDLPVKSGTVEAAAHVEYGPSNQAVTVDHVAVREPKIEYVKSPESQEVTADAREAASGAKAWQDVVTELFPISVQEVSVQNGDVAYRPGPAADPIRVYKLDMRVANLRNRPSESGDYPSELRVAAQLAEGAQFAVDGRADFFAKPLPGVDARVKVQDLHLGSLRPVAERFNVQLRQGRLDLTGRVHYSNSRAKVLIDEFLLDGANADYVHASATKDREAAHAKGAAQAAEAAHHDPAVQVKVDHGKILHSEMGFVNKAVSPDYRVYMADLNADMDHFSTKLDEGTGVVKITGKFMGSGPTTVIGTFRPEKPRPDFSLDVRIIKTPVRAMNDVLRAYGDVDTTGGTFAFFSQVSVKDDRIDGYVKPFLKDVDVYDPGQDKDKAVTQKVYEAVVGGVLGLFENRPRDEVATKTDLSGTVENPKADTWQIVGKLVQNAFFKAILPGFEGRVG